MSGYLTVREVAEKWHVTVRCVQISCKEGRIERAVKFGRDWMIPVDAERPEDRRVKFGVNV
ncbi:MAG: helix-turn-helix domain-containing protein [Lachnospiraceae bacterium]|nr:helix-turn-helix domain-containing protein [Lachnospiraceae bacterium]